jgi:hypothetical protein
MALNVIIPFIKKVKIERYVNSAMIFNFYISVIESIINLNQKHVFINE